MNKRFERQVLRLRPHFKVVEGYFYVTPVGHMLRGFVCDGPPSGKYISRYALPLYDRVDFISLTFSDRLPYPYDLLEVNPGEETYAAQEFVRRITPYESAVDSLSRFENFSSYVEAQGALSNPWVRRGYAMTQVMIGDRANAEAQLQILLETSAIDRYGGFREDIAQIHRDLISGGIAKAQRTLAVWEQETRKRFGLTD